MTTDERYEGMKAALRAYTKKITVSAAEARKALVSEGIYTQSGKLSKNYTPSKPKKL